MHHVIAAGEGSDRAPDSCKLCPYYRPDFKFRTCLYGANKFHFNWKDLVPSGLSVKDAIAPTALAFKNSRTFQMGGIFGAVSFLSITASDLSDQLLKDFLDMDSSQIVTMHIQSVDQNKAIKTIKHTITELDRSKIEEVRPDRALCSVA